MTEFTVAVDLNRHLPENGRVAESILTVTATGEAVAPVAPGLEMLIIDCSASMHGDRIRAAREATATAIELLRDGVAFVVIAGNHTAWQLYPRSGTARASAATRHAAAAAVAQLQAAGGTAMSTWLDLAGTIAAEHASGYKHAILLTDGHNGESEYLLHRTLQQISGMFTVDCRGIGADWSPDQLRAIASELLGTADIVAEPDLLAHDFGIIMTAAMDKTMPDLVLRVWAPVGATVRQLKQVAPVIEDLTGKGVAVDALRTDYPIGAWGAESRDYHLRIELDPRPVGATALVGRAEIRDGETVLAKGLVDVVWTADPALSTRLNPRVAHFSGQAELADAIMEGLAARRAGDLATATAKLGRAVALASSSGHEDTAKLLANVVDVVDAPSGTVQLRRDVSELDETALDIRSTRTVRVGRPR